MLLLLSSILFSGEPRVDQDMLVTASRGLTVFVPPVEILEGAEESLQASKYSVISLSENAKFFAKRKAMYGFEDFAEEIDIISNDMIRLMYDGCNYYGKPLKCSIENDHWYLKSVVSKNDTSTSLTVFIYDESGKVVAAHTRSKQRETRYYFDEQGKKQEVHRDPKITISDIRAAINSVWVQIRIK
jgi:YD repeat-containing protein